MLSCLFYKKKRHCKAAESAKSNAQKKVKRPDLTPKNLKLWTEDQLRVVRGLCHSSSKQDAPVGKGSCLSHRPAPPSHLMGGPSPAVTHHRVMMSLS